ncbi:MAG TPA: recombinase XerD, partial [Nitrospina sp.]|nr:recombinase XerD [Nitrospina sp.]
NHAGLKDVRIHDLRRTLGSWQAASGSSLPIIGKSLNHKNPSTTFIYARIDLDPVRKSVEIANEAIMKAANQPTEPSNEKILPISKKYKKK